MSSVVYVGSAYPPTASLTFTGTVTGTSVTGYTPPLQQFGTVTPRNIQTAGGVPSAQSFGTPTIKTVAHPVLGGVPSAQAFGVVSVKTVAYGVPSAQAFGAIYTVYTTHPSGVPTAQAFGTVVPKIFQPVPVLGIASAQLFGSPHIAWQQFPHPPGVSSAQAFGAVTIHGSIKPPVGGVSSAQAFGTIWLVYPQFTTVTGLDSAQAFGDTTTGLQVFHVWLHQFDCIQADPTICGYGSYPPDYGPNDPTICGERLCGGDPYFTTTLPPEEVLDLTASAPTQLDLVPATCT